MNTYIALACLLAVAHGSAIGGYVGHVGYGGYGGYGLGHGYSAPILAPAAISTANVVKAAPIPVIRTAYAPVVTAPILRTVSVAAPISVGYGYGGYGLGSYGLGSYSHGGYGLGGYGLGSYGHGAYGLGGYGLGSYGHGGYGFGYGKH